MSEKQPEPEVSIVVVSYNTAAMTLDCLRSVQRETRTPHEVIVIDNASGDGSAAAIRAEFPEIRLLAEDVNHGFAKANNVAAREARGRYLLLLNPDTVILDGAIDRLLDFARANPAAKIWGGKTLYGDGTLNRTSCFQAMNLWNVFCRSTGLASLTGNHRWFSETYGGWDMAGERAVDIVTGCFFLLPLALWRELGGFNPTYFMYGEEADLCLRAAARHGARPMVTDRAVITHYGGASEPVRADKMVRQTRAKLTLIRHHFPAWQRAAGLLLFRAIPLTRAGLGTAMAAILRSPGPRASAAAWREVWRRRGEWWDGFPEGG
jgi:hypothetical protein